MALDPAAPQSRRRLLTAATGGALALAASRLVQPSTAAAVGTPVDVDVDNPSTALTSITQATADTGAFKATATGIAPGVEGDSATGVGVLGITGGDGLPSVVGLQGDSTESSYAFAVDIDPEAPQLPAGMYGYTGDFGGIGAFGEAAAGIGVLGAGNDEGSLGVLAFGSLGAFVEGSDGAVVFSDNNGTGLHAHVGFLDGPPDPPLNTALFASVETSSQVGLEARGRIRFPSRSGRVTIGSGKSSVVKTVAGMTSSNFAIAVLNTSQSGRWVRAVVCGTGKITIYLNTTVPSATLVAWLVLG
jgi:hypothetical protein